MQQCPYKREKVGRGPGLPPQRRQLALLDQPPQARRALRNSRRIEHPDCDWEEHFTFLDDLGGSAGMVKAEINAFLTHQTARRKFSAKRQNKASWTFLFLYRYLFAPAVDELSDAIRACNLKCMAVAIPSLQWKPGPRTLGATNGSRPQPTTEKVIPIMRRPYGQK